MLSSLLALWIAPALPAIPAVSEASAVKWLVLPVEAKTPPPQDPTLRRLSSALFKSVERAALGEVQLAKPAVRDEHCAYRGIECPPEISGLLNVDLTVALYLKEDYTALALLVFKAPAGLLIKGKIPCKWDKGAVRCDEAAAEAFIKTVPLPERAMEPAVKQAFDQALEACAGKRHKETTARFVVAPDGKVSDVKIEPRRLRGAPRYRCVARKLEALSLPAFQSKKALPFSFSLD